MMKDKRHKGISWHGAVDAIVDCACRFPITVVYVLLLTGILITDTWTAGSGWDWARVRDVLVYGFSVGALLSLVIYLWSEERAGQSRGCTVCQTVASSMLAADCVWLYVVYPEIGDAVILGHAAVVTALVVAVFFVSFIGEKHDIVSWNFSRSLFVSVCVVALIALIMALAIGAIFGTLTMLFGDVQWEIWSTMLLIGSFAIPVLIFLGRIPSGSNKHDRSASPSRFLAGVVKYLFLPTVAIFYGVVYVYAFKILVNWELPEGNVCWPVSWAILACVVIEYLLYPSRIATSNRFTEAIARWLPVALMPLLVLMTVAICRRIGDYGITVSRLYILTLNIWGYGMCVWLWIKRADRVSWIPVSCAILFFITSAFPVVNYTSIVGAILRSQFGELLREYGAEELPLSVSAYNELADSLPREAENRLEGKFRYLLHNYGKDAVAGFVVVEPGMLREWSPWSAVDTCRSYSRNLMYDGDVVVPHGFCAMRLVDDYNATFRRMENRKVVVSVDSVEFTLDVDSVRRFYNNTGAASMETPILCSPTDVRDDRLLVLQRLYYYYPTDDSLTTLGISGVVFKR